MREVISSPWRTDEAFTKFVTDYRSTGAALIDEDFVAAFSFGWKPLDWEQKAERVKALAAHLPAYMRNPGFVPKPEKFLKQEWKRPVKPIKSAENGTAPYIPPPPDRVVGSPEWNAREEREKAALRKIYG